MFCACITIMFNIEGTRPVTMASIAPAPLQAKPIAPSTPAAGQSLATQSQQQTQMKITMPVVQGQQVRCCYTFQEFLHVKNHSSSHLLFRSFRPNPLELCTLHRQPMAKLVL